MSRLNDILSQGEKGRLPEDKLLAYLEGRLSPQEQHEVEKWLADEGMEGDAIEGLQQLDAGDAKYSVSKLNHKLRQELLNKKHHRKTAIKDNPWAMIAVIVILLVTILAYIVIRLAVKK